MQTPVIILMAFVAVAILAGRYGADSRDGFGPGSRPGT
jgi:hypothetical protein